MHVCVAAIFFKSDVYTVMQQLARFQLTVYCMFPVQ